jgi:hypothetical protein
MTKRANDTHAHGFASSFGDNITLPALQGWIWGKAELRGTTLAEEAMVAGSM